MMFSIFSYMYDDQEVRVRTVYGTTDWFRIEKGVWQSCLLSPCLFDLYAEHITHPNARLDELQDGIKNARRNINNLRYVDDITLMAESEEEVKKLLMRVKEESENADLKPNIKKKKTTKFMASGSIISWQIQEQKVEALTDFLSL